MNIGVIGSGSIGPDLAYGFLSSLSKGEGGKVYLADIKQDALDAGMERIRGYMAKGLSRGKLSPKAAKAMEAALIPTLTLGDLADCDYVLEAATEDLKIKRAILTDLEAVVRANCLIGFATSGIPREQIAAETKHPERCFVNHPFFPAWRSLPMEIVLSGDETYDTMMLETMQKLGKIPIVTADVPCFAADDIFCNYCAEAARIVEEGTATAAQVDQIVNAAIGGGGPFNVMDLTKGNLLNIHCLELMQQAPGGTDWFAPPAIFAKQANTPWHDRKNPGDPTHDAALAKTVLDRMLAVLIGRTYYVADNEICDPTELNWLTRTALGFGKGLLDLAADLGAERVHELCTTYAGDHPGFEVSKSVADKRLIEFKSNLKLERDDEIAVVTIFRPEVKNALDDRTMSELAATFEALAADKSVAGVVLTSADGALAGADIMELAALETPGEAREKCVGGHRVMEKIESTTASASDRCRAWLRSVAHGSSDSRPRGRRLGLGHGRSRDGRSGRRQRAGALASRRKGQAGPGRSAADERARRAAAGEHRTSLAGHRCGTRRRAARRSGPAARRGSRGRGRGLCAMQELRRLRHRHEELHPERPACPRGVHARVTERP